MLPHALPVDFFSDSFLHPSTVVCLGGLVEEFVLVWMKLFFSSSVGKGKKNRTFLFLIALDGMA